MSTKTSFNRIALVAVAAMGFGLLSAAPSSAAVNAESLQTVSQTNTYTLGSGTAAAITLQHTFVASAANDSATITMKLTKNVYNSVTSTLNAVLPVQTAPVAGLTNTATVTTTLNAAAGTAASLNTATGASVAFFKATFAPTEAGVYEITFSGASGSGVAPIVWTVTASAPAAPSAAHSTVDMISVQSLAEAGGDTAYLAFAFANNNVDGVVAGNASTSASVAGGTTTTNAGAAVIKVVEANGPAGSNTLTNATNYPVTATITGPGMLSFRNVGPVAKTVTESYCVTQVFYCSNNFSYLTKYIWVYSDGQTGPSTITISAGGNTLATRTLYFYGSIAKISATQNLKVAPINGTLGTAGAHSGTTVATTPAITVAGKDASGNLVGGLTSAGGTWSATSSDTSCISKSIAVIAQNDTADTYGSGFGHYGVQVSGAANAKSGCSATLTIKYTKSDGTTAFTADPVSFTTGGTTIYGAALSVTQDLPAGTKGTVTLTLKDKDGNPVADGDYAALAAVATGTITPSSPVTTAIMGTSGTRTVLSGITTSTFYAPVTPGTLTLSGAVGAAGSAALAGTAIATTTTIIGDGVAQAAADAAAEATDAANAATDAANAAAEAADAATAAAQDAADAVAALSTQVSEMIDALKKQITALTNLVIKIQKKVKA